MFYLWFFFFIKKRSKIDISGFPSSIEKFFSNFIFVMIFYEYLFKLFISCSGCTSFNILI